MEILLIILLIIIAAMLLFNVPWLMAIFTTYTPKILSDPKYIQEFLDNKEHNVKSNTLSGKITFIYNIESPGHSIATIPKSSYNFFNVSNIFTYEISNKGIVLKGSKLDKEIDKLFEETIVYEERQKELSEKIKRINSLLN